MFLRKSFNSKTGRTYLAIVQGYRDAQGRSKQKNIQSIGYLDELEKLYDDPITHFSALAAEMDQQRLIGSNVSINIDMAARLDRDVALRKNYGYIIYSMVYHELQIDRFLKNARRHQSFKFNTDAIMRLLVFTRLLFPGSKRAAVLDKNLFFDKFDFSLDDVYHALTHFDIISPALQKHLHEMVSAQYKRETNLVYYDVTNYYFEIDQQDDLRKRGAEKNHRNDPMVQMGLILDTQSLPIAYRLFPGNTHDSQTLMPMLTEIKRNFGVKRIIVVADKGLNSGDNIAYNTILGDGYIYSKSIRGASAEFKQWVLDQSGYRVLSDKSRIKSKIVPDAQVRVTYMQKGKKRFKTTETVEQKWIVFFSEKFASRSRHKREEAVAKALDMISNPGKYKRSIDYGAAGYIRNLKVDKDTGEILNPTDTLILDHEKIEQEARYDGYYAIITSELDDSDDHILQMYRGLWRIEESFKITKTTLEARPVYLQTPAHINAHFLICFLALLIARIVELRLDDRFSIAEITETLLSIGCSHIEQNLWLFDCVNEVTDAFNSEFGTDFGRKIMSLQEIRSNIGASKGLLSTD